MSKEVFFDFSSANILDSSLSFSKVFGTQETIDCLESSLKKIKDELIVSCYDQLPKDSSPENFTYSQLLSFAKNSKYTNTSVAVKRALWYAKDINDEFLSIDGAGDIVDRHWGGLRSNEYIDYLVVDNSQYEKIKVIIDGLKKALSDYVQQDQDEDE